MVDLLEIVIFHGELLNNQMVIGDALNNSCQKYCTMNHPTDD